MAHVDATPTPNPHSTLAMQRHACQVSLDNEIAFAVSLGADLIYPVTLFPG
jgi:hypothetical protein